MAISIQLNVNRNDGISPLTVVVNFIGTTADGVSNPFHRLDYQVDFGDPTSGNYSYGNPAVRSRNHSYDPVAGHCYEITEGDGDKQFTITATVTDGVLVQQVQTTITVYDPLGDNGYAVSHYVSQNTDFTGAPSDNNDNVEHHPNETSNLTTLISTYLNADNRRLVLHGEQTFTANSMTNNFARTRWAIQSFGGIATINSAGSNMVMQIDNSHDARFVDLEYDGQGVASTGLLNLGSATAGNTQITLLRVNVHDANSGIETLGPPQTHGHNQFGVFDCIFQDMLLSHGTFLECTDSALLGNLYQNIVDEHLVRFPLFRRSVYKNNKLTGYDASDKEGIALRGYPDASISQFWVVSDNETTQTEPGNVPMQCGAANSTEAAKIEDGIIRRNLWTHANNGGGAWLDITAKRVSIENNFHSNLNSAASGGDNNARSIAFRSAAPGDGNDAMDPNEDIWISHNTSVYPVDPIGGGSSEHRANLVALSADAVGTIAIKNNLVWAQATTFTSWFVHFTGSSSTPPVGATMDVSGNSTTTPSGGEFDTDPLLESSAPQASDDFKITENSYAVGSGTADIKVFRDYFGTWRDQSALDKGAHAFTEGAFPASQTPRVLFRSLA